ncbi:kinesin-like protein KIF20B isoform X1 [Hydra vulgaris]|uniref:kinesin-like protein KIF20B isoform X1 n=1 Tax=Hydra vulgaris TaxID=6087 RepID=UPI001F5EF47F|nr:kinesin-like protein KIF20B [Hydra vulgaris]XP_047142793.1 kinesin-like protein KIF20B [Hydra vulgaris]
MTENIDGTLKVNENEGIIAVGSLAELADLLANMSSEQLKNVQLDPILYNALSQTIEPELQLPIDIPEIDMSTVSIVSDVAIPLEEIVSNAIILPNSIPISNIKAFEGAVQHPLHSTVNLQNSFNIDQPTEKQIEHRAKQISNLSNKEFSGESQSLNIHDQHSETKNINAPIVINFPEPGIKQSFLKNLPSVTSSQPQKQLNTSVKSSIFNTNLSLPKQKEKVLSNSPHLSSPSALQSTPTAQKKSNIKDKNKQSFKSEDDKELNMAKVLNFSVSKASTVSGINSSQPHTVSIHSSIHKPQTNVRCSNFSNISKANENFQKNTARVASVYNSSCINSLKNSPQNLQYKTAAATKLVDSNFSVSSSLASKSPNVASLNKNFTQNKLLASNGKKVSPNQIPQNQVCEEVDEVEEIRNAILSSKVSGEDALRELAKLEIENQMKRFKKTVPKIFKKEEQEGSPYNSSASKVEIFNKSRELSESILGKKSQNQGNQGIIHKNQSDEPRKRARPKKFDDFVFETEVKKEKVEILNQKFESSNQKVELNQKSDTLNQKIELLKEKIDPLKDKIEQLKEKVEPLKEKVEPLKEKVEPLKEKVEPLKEKIEPYKEKVEPLKEKNEPLKEKIEKERIEPLKEKKNRYFFPSSSKETSKQINPSVSSLPEINNKSDNSSISIKKADCLNSQNSSAEIKFGECVETQKEVAKKEIITSNIDKHTEKKKISQLNKKKKKKSKKKAKIAFEPEVLPEHLKKQKAKQPCNPVIDLNKVRLKSAYDESNFLLDNTVEIEVFKALHRTGWECTMCGKPGNIGDLDVLFGPYKVNIRDSDDKLEVWLHRDCAIWTSTICLANQTLCGVGDALQHAAKTKCSLCSRLGATLECCSKQCRDGYHYICARQRGCTFNENFTITCPKHK